MGRRSKEKQLVAHASRRRTVLQIDKVSRREVSEGPVKTGITRTVNPNSITGIGLLGAYGDHSDDEEEGGGGEEPQGTAVEERNDYNSHQEEGPATASTSTTGQHSEIDAKLADFFKEIESMDPDTTSSAVEDDVKRAPDEAVSSTTDDRIMSEEGYEPEEPASSSGNDGVTYPWQMCLDEGTNCYYYWNTETNEVQWYPPVQETAVPDTQTVDEGRDPGEKPVTLVPEYQEDNSDHERPQSENEEKASEAASENSSKEAHSKPNSDDDMHMDGFRVLDSWEDKENGLQVNLSVKKASPEEMHEATDTDKVPAKRLKIEEFEEDSDDEFAAQLLEDTYEKGKKDILVEESMELSEDEGDKMEDEESDKEDKCLLPPEVFEHLRTAPPVPEKKETTPVIDEKETKHTTIKEVEYRSQILSLSSVLTNKLDFLEVSRDGMSTLKILLIEMETRIADWREGALDSHHLVQKLCQADKQLKQYEESASPPGWTCHWDRSHKRYYYRHQVTGDAQWEYPTDEVNRDSDNSSGTAAALQSSTAALQSSAAQLQSSAPLQSSSVALQTSAALQSSAAVHSSAVAVDTSAQSSLPMWSIPGYVTMVQAPVMPVVMTTVPVVSSSVTAESYMNPPVPGTDDGSEAVPFTVSFSEAEEESPPPPPGTDDLPPLPPVDSPAPPPPPPEPSEEIPPPPPGEEIIASPKAFATRLSAAITKGQATVCTSVTKSAPPVRSLVDYSDLDNFGTSAPPTDVTVAVPQSVGTQLTAAIQGATETTVPLPAATGTKTKTKRKKKTPKVSSTLLSSKARKVSSLVQKWQSIKQQEEPGLESSEEDEEENNPAKQIEDWKKEHVMSGQSNYNPNFEEIKGDWRERIRQRQAKVKTKAAADEKDT